MVAVVMANEDVEVMERGGVRCEEAEDLVLLQPLVDGEAPVALAVQKPRLASLDVFRGLSIAVCALFRDDAAVFLGPDLCCSERVCFLLRSLRNTSCVWWPWPRDISCM